MLHLLCLELRHNSMQLFSHDRAYPRPWHPCFQMMKSLGLSVLRDIACRELSMSFYCIEREWQIVSSKKRSNVRLCVKQLHCTVRSIRQCVCDSVWQCKTASGTDGTLGISRLASHRQSRIIPSKEQWEAARREKDKQGRRSRRTAFCIGWKHPSYFIHPRSQFSIGGFFSTMSIHWGPRKSFQGLVLDLPWKGFKLYYSAQEAPLKQGGRIWNDII